MVCTCASDVPSRRRESQTGGEGRTRGSPGHGTPVTSWSVEHDGPRPSPVYPDLEPPPYILPPSPLRQRYPRSPILQVRDRPGSRAFRGRPSPRYRTDSLLRGLPGLFSPGLRVSVPTGVLQCTYETPLGRPLPRSRGPLGSRPEKTSGFVTVVSRPEW